MRKLVLTTLARENLKDVLSSLSLNLELIQELSLLIKSIKV